MRNPESGIRNRIDSAFRSPICALFPLLLATGCAHLTEHQILEKYFAASRVRDAVVLRTIATVAFEPRRDGAVRRLRIISVGADGRRRVTLPAGVPLPAGPHHGAPDIDRLEQDAGIRRGDVASGPPLSGDARLAALSIYDPRYDYDLAGGRAEITERDVTISAYLLPLEGEMRWEMLRVRLEKADVTLASSQQVRGKWIVTRVRRL